MDLFIVPQDVLNDLIKSPGDVWIGPTNRYAATFFEGQLYIIAGDFTNVTDGDDLNNLIGQHFQ